MVDILTLNFCTKLCITYPPQIEEDVLVKTILDLREQGYTVTSTDIKRICYEYCDTNGIPNQFNAEKRLASDDWYYGYLKRHPEIRTSKQTTIIFFVFLTIYNLFSCFL